MDDFEMNIEIVPHTLGTQGLINVCVLSPV